MSTKSSTPVVAYPYEMAEVELKALKLEATDSSSNPLGHYEHEWESTEEDGGRRVDLRDKYDKYEDDDDDLYSDINELKISLTFDVNTKDCLQSGNEFIAGIHLKSSMSRYEVYETLSKESRTSKALEKTVELTLNKATVQRLRGNIIVSPIVVLASDSLGTPPVKKGGKVFATANRSILSTRDATNEFTIMFDDSGPPTSSGMEVKWEDMSGHEKALYSLSYLEIETSEDSMHVRLVLNKESHLYALSKIPKGGPATKKKALKDLILTEIVCDVQVKLLSDLVRFFGNEMQECVDGTKETEPGSALEYAMGVLDTISEKTDYSNDGLLKILEDDRGAIDKITLKLQHSKNLKGMLTKLYNYIV